MILEAAEALDGRVEVPYRPQDDRLATWEPSLDAHPLYRPELLELGT
jgi:methionyl-tRNA formyltransferase